MLVLKSEKGEVYNLFTRKKHVVGRNGNLELEGDKSVSRQHAVIHITIKDKKPQILLQDLGSKYGTFVNDSIESATEIAKNTPTYLKIGDRIRFGQQWNTWTVEESQFVVCSSTLTTQEKTSLKSLLSAMNGVLVSQWTENCTHLTMNDIKITIKVVCALGGVKPIINMDYWRALSDIMKSKVQESIPDCDDYVPPLAEPSLMNVPISFKMNNFRKRLFRDMKFVACTTAQYNTVLPMITNGGGTVIDGTRNVITEEQYEKEKILVLGSTTSVNRRNRNLAQILKYLEKNKHRCIAESEIGLSLLFCSTDKHCNPTYDASFILGQPESQIVIKDEESILDLETQDLGDENSTQFFDDSSKFSLAVNEKRTFSDSDEEQVISETQPSRIQTQSIASKRKLEEGSDKPNLKSTKLDNWLILKKPAPKIVTSTESSQSVPVEKKTKSLFAFPRDKKTTGSSDSLFKTLNTSSSSEKSESRKRSSIELFSTIESSPVPMKKQNVDLAQPSTSREQRSLILFDSNELIDSFSEKTAKMNITNKPKPVVVDSPVVVPRNISLSQFVDVPKNKSNGEIKEEPADMTSEVREVFDKTVVHTLPLIKNNKTITEPTGANRSVVNFKKFKKNNGFSRSCVISTNDFFLFRSKSEPRNDICMNGDSDSSN